MFEKLSDRAVNQPFERQDESQLNPRQMALEAIVKEYRDHPQTLVLVRDRAEQDPDEKVREFLVQQLANDWKDDPDTLPWLKMRVQSEKCPEVVKALIQALASVGKDDLATLNWFKTYSQYSQNPLVRATAVQALARGWKNEFNVFEILCKCAFGDPFEHQNDLGVNPRQAALEVMAEQYSDSQQTREILQDRAEKDPDEQVREFAKEKLKQFA